MPSSLIVVDRNGMRGTADPADLGSEQVKVRWENGRETVIPAGSLTARSDGTYAVPVDSMDSSAGSGSIVVPVLEERLDISKRTVETGGGVRVHKIVHEHEELIDQALLVQEVDVVRVPIGKVVEGPVAVRHDGDTMIVPILEERLIIQKQLILKEEIHITKRQLTNRQPQRVTVRTEEARIERFGDSGELSKAPASLEPPSDPPQATQVTRQVTGGSVLDRVFPPEETRKRKKAPLKKGD